MKTSNKIQQELIPASKFLIPNGITVASLIFGVIASILSVEGRLLHSNEKFYYACYCLYASAFCDFLDGFVARLTRTTSLFGMQFDSLCDLIAFGIAPVIIIYNYCLHDYKTKGEQFTIQFKKGIILVAIYVSCGAIRLARFNVMSLNKESLKMSLGLPIPLAATMLISMLLYFMNKTNLSMVQQKEIMAGATVYLSIAMISNFDYISNKALPSGKNSRKILGLIGLSIILLLIVNFYMISFMIHLIYCLSGPITSLIKYFINSEEIKIKIN